MSALARFALVFLMLALALPFTGCSDPCGQLEVKVCQPTNPKLKREFASACKLLGEPKRRDNLSKATCQSILDHLSKR